MTRRFLPICVLVGRGIQIGVAAPCCHKLHILRFRLKPKAHYPQGARPIRKVALLPTAGLSFRAFSSPHEKAPPFRGGPVGLSTIATALGEDPGTIEDVYEPFLIKEGFLQRTPRGREVTDLAWRHLGLTRPDYGGLF